MDTPKNYLSNIHQHSTRPSLVIEDLNGYFKVKFYHKPSAFYAQTALIVLTPTGRSTPKYLSGVFVIGVQHESFGQGQFPFVRAQTDERRLAAVIHRVPCRTK